MNAVLINEKALQIYLRERKIIDRHLLHIYILDNLMLLKEVSCLLRLHLFD